MPLADLIRRLTRRGVEIEVVGDLYFFHRRGHPSDSHVLPDPVPAALVRDIANRLGLNRLMLYFDDVESDRH